MHAYEKGTEEEDERTKRERMEGLKWLMNSASLNFGYNITSLQAIA